MSTLTLFWLATGIIFLIVEIITVSFYGLSLSLAAFGVTLYVWIDGSTDFTILQGVIFVVIATLFSYFLPKWLTPDTKDAQEVPQGLDMYIGMEKMTKQVGEDLKITLDGVDYIVIGDDEPLQPKQTIKIVSRKGSLFYGIPRK
ncbi:hypothetical protein CSB09_03230 [Candidatus Gracilibacteria bacterium]|nr:MAG: hypothetical protein CSB09_03230 [Candidatus Gracilibacteria bacterium]